MKSLISLFIIFNLQTVNLVDIRSNVDYKTGRIEKEYLQLERRNYQLYQLVMLTANYSMEKYNKKLIITEVYRTQQEQDKYYKGKRKFTSPHQRWLAVDIRTRNYTKSERKDIVNMINSMYNVENTYIPTAFYHNMGLGEHIHVQFKDRE